MPFLSLSAAKKIVSDLLLLDEKQQNEKLKLFNLEKVESCIFATENMRRELEASFHVSNSEFQQLDKYLRESLNQNEDYSIDESPEAYKNLQKIRSFVPDITELNKVMFALNIRLSSLKQFKKNQMHLLLQQSIMTQQQILARLLPGHNSSITDPSSYSIGSLDEDEATQPQQNKESKTDVEGLTVQGAENLVALEVLESFDAIFQEKSKIQKQKDEQEKRLEISEKQVSLLQRQNAELTQSNEQLKTNLDLTLSELSKRIRLEPIKESSNELKLSNSPAIFNNRG